MSTILKGLSSFFRLFFFFPLQDNLSPLHVAAGMGHIDVTKRLLENGAHMEAEDNALYTPLWRAAYYGHPEVVEVRFTVSVYFVFRQGQGGVVLRWW